MVVVATDEVRDRIRQVVLRPYTVLLPVIVDVREVERPCGQREAFFDLLSANRRASGAEGAACSNAGQTVERSFPFGLRN